ncbi:hypothetical protein PVAP13_5KG780450 [Panicum virgatum]|uniref:Uncharacterized protein n=1 Tax=Panicum virgatum TaxID=38727 RepID=A0A8T0SXV0_PANVG|nr:hypothetical protein PVAP13_5KG780450 [Panicum virgatum]
MISKLSCQSQWLPRKDIHQVQQRTKKFRGLYMNPTNPVIYMIRIAPFLKLEQRKAVSDSSATNTA